MKKITSIILSVLLIISCSACDSSKETEDMTTEETAGNQSFSYNTVKSVEWNIENGILILSGTGEMTDYSSDDRSPWYEQKDEITKAVINNGITSVGNYTFSDCHNLVSVEIPESVISIGKCA